MLGNLGRHTHIRGGEYVYLVVIAYYIEVMTKNEDTLLVPRSRHPYLCDDVYRRLN